MGHFNPAASILWATLGPHVLTISLSQCSYRCWWCQSARHWSSGGETPHRSSPGTWHKLVAQASFCIFSNTRGADYRTNATSLSWFLDPTSSVRPPEGSRIHRSSAPRHAEAPAANEPRAGRSWNVVWCSVGNKKADPLRSPRWRTTLCPHLGMMPYESGIYGVLRNCAYYSITVEMACHLKSSLCFGPKKTNTKKSGNVKIERIESSVWKATWKKLQFAVLAAKDLQV